MDRLHLQAIERERAAERDRLHVMASARRGPPRPTDPSWLARLVARVTSAYGSHSTGRSERVGG